MFLFYNICPLTHFHISSKLSCQYDLLSLWILALGYKPLDRHSREKCGEQ